MVGKAQIEEMRRTYGYIRNHGKINLYKKQKISKNAPSRAHRNLICDNYGLDEWRLNEFNLHDYAIDEPVSILLGIHLGLNKKPVNPQSLGLLNTPIMPNLKIIQ